MRAHITPVRVAAGLVVALVATFVILVKIPSDKYILTPAGAHPVAPLVQVKGAKTPKGSGTIDFVDVYVSKASELDVLFPWLHPHATFVPATAIVPKGSSDAAVNKIGLQEMASSQKTAAAVAEQALGYHSITPTGVRVDAIARKTDAARKLKPGDVISAVDGRPTPTLTLLRLAIGALRPGDDATLVLRRGTHTRTVRVKLVPKPGNPSRAIIGIQVEQMATVKLPVKVSIDAHGIGGPSAGLAFTLEVMQKLGRDVTHGYTVAATGQINLDGSVSAIGGVEQKTWGVRDAGIDVFLVPVDQGNAKEAEKFAGPNLIIIPVTSLKQALRALAHLPKLK